MTRKPPLFIIRIIRQIVEASFPPVFQQPQKRKIIACCWNSMSIESQKFRFTDVQWNYAQSHSQPPIARSSVRTGIRAFTVVCKNKDCGNTWGVGQLEGQVAEMVAVSRSSFHTVCLIRSRERLDRNGLAATLAQNT